MYFFRQNLNIYILSSLGLPIIYNIFEEAYNHLGKELSKVDLNWPKIHFTNLCRNQGEKNHVIKIIKTLSNANLFSKHPQFIITKRIVRSKYPSFTKSIYSFFRRKLEIGKAIKNILRCIIRPGYFDNLLSV